MKIVKENINEKFAEHTDPIKDMDIGALRVYAITVKLTTEQWQTGDGVDIVVARSKKQAKEIWLAEGNKLYYGKPAIREIKEINITKKGFYHIEDAAVE